MIQMKIILIINMQLEKKLIICKQKIPQRIITKNDRHDNGNWVSATISDNLDEMIKISLAGDYSQWIYYDSDKTGPQLKVQSHTKNNVDFYKT